MMRLTTDLANIAEAEAKARITLDEIAILLAPPGVTSVPGILDGLMPDTKGSSAKIARERLRCIVLQDRETCPAWRWVPVKVRQIAIWNGFSLETVMVSALKRAFRWERRR